MKTVQLKRITIVAKTGAMIEYTDVLHVTQNLSFLKIEYLKNNKVIEAVLPLALLSAYTSHIQGVHNPYVE